MKNEYRVVGDIVILYAWRKGWQYQVLIDANKLSAVSSGNHTWSVLTNGNSGLYVAKTVRENGKRKTIRLSRVVTGCYDGNLMVDHRNGNTL